MESNGCYQPVLELVNEGTAEFSGYELNKTKYDALGKICEMVDKAVNETGHCECIDASIDDTTKQLTISILTGDVFFQHGRTSAFFRLIQMLDSFSFSSTKNGLLRTDLNIDGMWEKKSEQ